MKWLFFYLFNVYVSTIGVEVISCDETIQVQYQGQIQVLELFNVEVVDMSRACALLNGAQQVEVVLEPNIQKTDTLLGWVFVDDVLLQQLLVDEEVATIVRKNPLYQYSLEEESVSVSTALITPIVVDRSHGYIIISITLLITILFIVLAKTVKY